MIISNLEYVSNKNQFFNKVKLTQKVLVKCDNIYCSNSFESKYYIVLNNRKKYNNKDLCRSCKLKEQYSCGLRDNQKKIISQIVKSTQTGISLEQRIGKEKSDEAKHKMSLKSSGKNNINYGGKFNTGFGSIWQPSNKGKTYEDIYDKEKIIEIKKKQSFHSSGKNNKRFGLTPAQGSGNGWQGWYKGWYFRSLLELSYMINVIEKNGWKWISAESNEYKISYVMDDKERNYFCDFLVEDNLLIEIKPKNLRKSKQVLIKEEAAIKWCEEHNLVYKIVCDNEFEKLTDEEIKILHDNNIIKFINRYEEKFNARFK